MTQFYQGDVGLVKIDKQPQVEFKPLPKVGFVIAEGESTGHTHTVTAEKDAVVEMGQDEFGTYIKVLKGSASLVHQKHKVQTMTPGIWVLPLQFEYDEISELRRVAD